MEIEPVIGLEIHAQLKTRTKIFCDCPTEFGAPANTQTCPVCLGMPGVLPVLNRQVVEYTLRMALATDCRILRESRFARKNYFYPDLPKGYQISQYELPIARQGHVDVRVDGRLKRIGITRIHMEEDAGKLIHDPSRPYSRVDLNRTGVPLMEIVSEPDMRTPLEAGAYLRQLRAILRYLEICDGNMEEGSFRCDANISIRPAGAAALGTRAEIKNLNSFKNVEKALHYEIQRQREILQDGAEVLQETRLWDPDRGRTNSMRGKEEAHDYRYFPDPDLLPLIIDESWIETVRKNLPELPAARRQRFIDDYGLPPVDAQYLTAERELAEYFEACAAAFPHPKTVSNWMMGSLPAMLKATGKSIGESPVSPGQLAQLLQMVEKGTISGKIAKAVLDEMAQTGLPPAEIVRAKGLVQVTDPAAIENVVAKILADNPLEVTEFKNGKTKILGFFVGQVMKATGGKANPKIVNEVLKRMLTNQP